MSDNLRDRCFHIERLSASSTTGRPRDIFEVTEMVLYPAGWMQQRAVLRHTLEQARAAVPFGFVCRPRSESEVGSPIIETWEPNLN